MRNKTITLLCVAIALSGCEKASFNDEWAVGPAPLATSTLSVTTRGAGVDGGATIPDGRIYVFNKSNTCVALLTTGEAGQTESAQLPAGTYTLCAVGSEDLSIYNLPAQGEATPSSVISLKSGEERGDLLMKNSTTTLEDGDTKALSIELFHQVLCLDAVEIRQVPTNVTKVEVTMGKFYSTIQLNLTKPDTPTEDYTVSLTKQANGTTWKATPEQMLLPSVGKPSIKVLFTTDNDTRGYAYTASEDLKANNHVSITGTYAGAVNATLSGKLSAAAWGNGQDLSFDFDKTLTYYAPVAGQYTNGYYAVSVDETNRKAVLLAKENLDFNRPTNDDWRTMINGKLAAYALPVNITGSWRLPTSAEVAVFSKDPQIATSINTKGFSKYYMYDDNGTLGWARTQKTYTEYNLQKSDVYNNDDARLRPVIDITF